MKALLLAFYILTADRGDYDGKNLVFSGQFQIEHPMGSLKAAKATLSDLQLHRSGKKSAQLFLENGVSIEASRGKTPLAISADSASCALPPNSLFSFLQLQELQFHGNVEIRTLKGIVARGGSALYQTGSLTLYPPIPSSHCQLLREADRLDAREIRFDVFTEELHCLEPRGWIAEKKGFPPLSFSARSLVWHKKEEKLRLMDEVKIEQENQVSLFADRALLSFENEFEPNLLHLEGNVRLLSSRIQGKESFSMADEILFEPKEQKLILKANAPKRVLFWQEGLSLSAPEIHIVRDPATEKESIFGKGDVHFAFDTEEKNMIDQLLSKYL